MGGKNKQIIGYKYFLGIHAVLCESPIDDLLELKFKDKSGWRGTARNGNGEISIWRPNLWGGHKKEGGVGGTIKVLFGEAAQKPYWYLKSVIRNPLPAFRGVVSLSFNQFYWGDNPYLKPWSAKAKAVYSTTGNWEPGLAPIAPEFDIRDASIIIALDNSSSMATGDAINGGSRYNAVMRSTLEFISKALATEKNLNIRIVLWSDTTIARNWYNATYENDYLDMEVWMDANYDATGGQTYYDTAFVDAETFYSGSETDVGLSDGLDTFGNIAGLSTGEGDQTDSGSNRRLMFFVSDGEPTSSYSAALAARDSTGMELFCVSAVTDPASDSMVELDNTPLDGVPVIDWVDDGDVMANIMGGMFATWCDINPIHILRELIVSPSYGGDGDDSVIGTSFRTSAVTLASEGFGLSFFHKTPKNKEEFKKQIEEHIDGHMYFDRTTGLWEVKLIRDDYTVGSLFTFDGSNIKEWVEAKRPTQVELPNQLKVEYTRRDNGKTTSLQVTNIAAVQMIGRIIPDKVTYEGITQNSLAAKVAARDLAAQTVPLWAGSFRAAYAPTDINVGSAIIVNEPRVGIENIVARVSEIEEGDGRDNTVLIRFVQDKYSLDDAAVSFDDDVNDDLVQNPDGTSDNALPADVTWVKEIPYWILDRKLGSSALESQLNTDQDSGYLGVTSNRPNKLHVSGGFAFNDSGSWELLGEYELAPAAQLTSGLTIAADDTEFTASWDDTLADAYPGQLVQVGDEIMRLDSMTVDDTQLPTEATITVGRGVLDTVPDNHAAGDWMIAWQDYALADETTYTAGESYTIRVLPATTSAILDPSKATDDDIVFASRAYSPYPVGKLQLDGSYLPQVLVGSFDATWAHRDRTAQLSDTPEDFTAASIGPETDVEYSVGIYAALMREDQFALTDWFEDSDFFVNGGTQKILPDPQLSPVDALTHTIDSVPDWFDLSASDIFDTADVPDWFAVPQGRGIFYEVKVDVSRGSPAYTNWQTARVWGRPLQAPYNLRATVS